MEISGSLCGKVSVIVPIYNCAKYIPRCMEKLLAQTYADIEILLVDDGSSDESLRICNEYATADSRVVVLHHENHGVSYTRNRGLIEAKGEFITFVDADDWVTVDYIQTLREYIDCQNVEIAMCGYVLTYENGNCQSINNHEPALLTSDIALDMFSPYYMGGICSKLYSRKALLDSEGTMLLFDEDISIGEDQLFWFRAVLNAGYVYTSSEPLYFYFVHNGSAMRTRKFGACYSDFLARKRIGQLVCKYPSLERANTLFCTAAAAQAMQVSELPSNNPLMSELSEFLKANIGIFLKHPLISTREKLRAILVSTKLLRKLFFCLYKFKQISKLS